MNAKLKAISAIFGAAALMASGAGADQIDPETGALSTGSSSSPAGGLTMVTNNSAEAHADHQYPPFAQTYESAEAEIDLAPIEFFDDQAVSEDVMHADHQYPPYVQ